MPALERRMFVKVAVDILILLTVAIPILIFFLAGVPFQRGWFCEDDSIRYPYKDSTISSVVLYLVGTLFPFITIVITEYVMVWKSRTMVSSQQRVRIYAASLYRFVGCLLFASALSQLITDILKYSIGRLRPHFIDLCNPDWDKVDCRLNPHRYITEDVCAPPGSEEAAFRLKEARLSFVSGHASFSAVTMFFLIFYLQYRGNVRGYHLLRPLIQIIAFLMTLFTAASRLFDYKHHWSDVLGGFILGTSVAAYVAFYVAEVRPRKTGVFVDKDNDDNFQLDECTLRSEPGNAHVGVLNA